MSAPRSLWLIAIQEFTASLLLFFMLFPAGSYFGDTNMGWALHWVALILHGVICGDAAVNPSVALALWTMGLMSFREAYIRCASDMLAGAIAYSAMIYVIPGSIKLGGSALQTDIETGAFIECWASFIVMFCILIATSKACMSVIPIPNITIGICVRALLYLEAGKFTGCIMNPMIAFAYLIHCHDVTKDIMIAATATVPLTTIWDVATVAFDWLTVYVVAPTVGCVWAGWAYGMLTSTTESVMHGVDTKNKKLS